MAEHLDRAMRRLLALRDERGLNYIAEGDWCDPMNMVGYQGKAYRVPGRTYAIEVRLPKA